MTAAPTLPPTIPPGILSTILFFAVLPPDFFDSGSSSGRSRQTRPSSCSICGGMVGTHSSGFPLTLKDSRFSRPTTRLGCRTTSLLALRSTCSRAAAPAKKPRGRVSRLLLESVKRVSLGVASRAPSPTFTTSDPVMLRLSSEPRLLKNSAPSLSLSGTSLIIRDSTLSPK